MNTSETQAVLVGALFEAKREFPRIEKNKRGQSGNRHFNYAPLDAIQDAVDPILYKHGLFITQGTDGHNLVTRLEHVCGQWRETSMPVNAEHANMQSYGIEITYRRRYSYQLILGIVTEEDIDIKEKNRTKGVDNTIEKNANGTEKLGWVDSPKQDAFNALQPEIQLFMRNVATQVVASIADSDPSHAIAIIELAIEQWPDEDPSQLKIALWHLLDSKTRAAIKKAQQLKEAA